MPGPGWSDGPFPLTRRVSRSPAAVRREAEEAAERLEQRREKLRRLLAEEREALAAELRRARGPGAVGMRQRSEELGAGREERRSRVRGAVGRPRPRLFAARLCPAPGEASQPGSVGRGARGSCSSPSSGGCSQV